MVTAKQILLEGFEDLDNEHASFNDPAFADNKTLPIHRWVPWIAGFSSKFVDSLLNTHLPSRGTVLDPFAGVGTTLVQAMLRGHNAVGFEINPYAALSCRVKAHSHRVNVQALKRDVKTFREFYHAKVHSAYTPTHQSPKGFRTWSPFYSPKVLRKVLIVLDYTETIEDTLIRNLFRLAFAATMVRYSNYSYEPSLGRRVSAGKEAIEDFTVGEAIRGKLSQMVEDIEWFQGCLREQEAEPEAKLFNTSFFDYADHLKPESIDLVITSPPYLNNYHYNRNTRPQLYWLGYAEKPKDLKPLEHKNLGKYWQTVRGETRIDLEFEMPDSDIVERLEMLRAKNPDKGIYGGKGWANYAASYFNDSRKFASGLRYALKSGKHAFVVIGNSILQGIMMPTDRYFGEIAESVGLDLIEIHIPREERVGSSIIQSDVRVGKAKDTQRLYEAVVELRKP